MPGKAKALINVTRCNSQTYTMCSGAHVALCLWESLEELMEGSKTFRPSQLISVGISATHTEKCCKLDLVHSCSQRFYAGLLAEIDLISQR